MGVGRFLSGTAECAVDEPRLSTHQVRRFLPGLRPHWPLFESIQHEGFGSPRVSAVTAPHGSDAKVISSTNARHLSGTRSTSPAGLGDGAQVVPTCSSAGPVMHLVMQHRVA